MANERIIGIDFGTSTSVIKVKMYKSNGTPIGSNDTVQSVKFNNSTLTPTVIKKHNDKLSFGYAALVPSRNSEVYQNFKLGLQSKVPEEVEKSKTLVLEFFKDLYSTYDHQLKTGGELGSVDDNEKTIVSYPVKWDDAGRDFMIEVAEKAGFKNVEGMDEAEAAVHAVTTVYKNSIKPNAIDKPVNIMLIDMGAGTTDIVISSTTFNNGVNNEILTTWPKAGGATFGGQEIDKILKNYLISLFDDSFKETVDKRVELKDVKKWKEEVISPNLNDNEVIDDYGSPISYVYYENNTGFKGINLTRDSFEDLLQDYINDFVKLVAGAIQSASLLPSDIDYIILTGGHSKWYFVKDLLLGKNPKFENFNLTKIIEDESRILTVAIPQETVALGLVYSKLPNTSNVDKATLYWHEFLETKHYVLLKKAAELGNAEAMNRYGYVLYNGEDVAKDIDKAIHYFNQAAEKGLAKSLYNLGLLHFERNEFKEGFDCFHKAYIEGNYAKAAFNCAVCYEKGLGVQENITKAMKAYEDAQKLGYIPAMKKLNNPEYSYKSIIDYIKTFDRFENSTFFIGEEIPENLINGMFNGYSDNKYDNHYICGMDTSNFASGEEGFIITDKNLYLRSTLTNGNLLKIEIDELDKLEDIDGKFHLTLKDDLVFVKEEGSVLPCNISTYERKAFRELFDVIITTIQEKE